MSNATIETAAPRKRFKAVFTSREIPHLWAHQTQSHARNATNNFYFSGDTIYSYGSHFPIARTVLNDQERVYLLTTKGYSNTTAKHICLVSRAIPNDAPTFNVPDVLASTKAQHKANLERYVERVEGLKADFEKSVFHKDNIAASINKLVAEANAYAKVFDTKDRLSWRISKAQLDSVNISVEKRRVRDAKASVTRERKNAEWEVAKAAQQAKAAADAAEDVQKWIAGEITSLNARWNLPVFLRRAVKNHGAANQCFALETSRGVKVPLGDAERAFKLINACREHKRSWRRNGETIHVGEFQIDSIAETGDIVAGCHKIHWTEIERFAKSQNWF